MPQAGRWELPQTLRYVGSGSEAFFPFDCPWELNPTTRASVAMPEPPCPSDNELPTPGVPCVPHFLWTLASLLTLPVLCPDSRWLSPQPVGLHGDIGVALLPELWALTPRPPPRHRPRGSSSHGRAALAHTDPPGKRVFDSSSPSIKQVFNVSLEGDEKVAHLHHSRPRLHTKQEVILSQVLAAYLPLRLFWRLRGLCVAPASPRAPGRAPGPCPHLALFTKGQVEGTRAVQPWFIECPSDAQQNRACT